MTENNVNAGSTEHLVGVSSKKYRLHSRLVQGRSALELRLAAAVLILGLTFVALLIAVAILAALYNSRKTPVCHTKECIKSAAMLIESMDTSVDPCEDFYRFTCGKWKEAHVTSESGYSWFTERTRFLHKKMMSLLEENVTKSDPIPLAQAKYLYRSCVDTDQLDTLGLEPLFMVLENASLPRLVPSESTGRRFHLAATLAKVQRILSMDILVQISISINPATNLTIFNLGAGVGGTSLPEIVSTEERVSVSPREALSLRLTYMTGVLAVLEPGLNVTQLGTLALKILLVDSQIKQDIQRTSTPSDPSVLTSFHQLQELMDKTNSSGKPMIRFDWEEYLQELSKGLNKTLSMNDTVMLDSPEFFVALAKRLHKTRPETLQRYIWWKVVSALVPHSTSELRDLKEELYESLFRRPRRKREQKCVRYVKTFLNMAIGYRLASENNLKTTAKKIRMMLKDIETSFNRLVDSLPWIDGKTKAVVWEKASAIKSYIGYPDWLLEPGQLLDYYKGLQVIEGQFLLSMVNIKSVEVLEILNYLGEREKNDSHSWMTDPLEVNAYYARSTNAIAIPAGILQTPFYFLGLEALNYGAIGTILGHELTHAFDVDGKDYDSHGDKNTWWDADMTKEYNQRADCFVRQYDDFTIDGTHKINGTSTLAENIADNGGVREALQAYKSFVKRNGEEPYLPGMENYTHEQLFFLSFANVWCEDYSLDSDLTALLDVHSPNRFRVQGTLANSEDFAEVWNCPKTSRMNPDKKCILW